MNKKNLLKIIRREVSILADFIDGFEEGENILPMEVDIVLSKAKDIYDELLLLKSDTAESSALKITVEDKPVIEAKENLPDLSDKKLIEEKAIIEPEPVVVDEIKPEIIEETEKESAQLPVDTIEEINAVLEQDKVEEIPAVEPVGLKPVVEEEIAKETDITEDLSEIEKEEADAIVVSNKQDFIEEASERVHDDVVQENAIKSEIVADKFSKDSLSLNDMLAGVKRNKDLASLLKDSPILDLKRAIKINDRIWFINELFNKNSTSFDKTIDIINNSDNLDKALEHLFTNFKWDQDRKSTISFLELVFRRFASK